MESKNNLAEINADDDFPLEIREAADQSAVADFIEESKTFEELVLALKVYFGLDDEYYKERAKFKAVSNALNEAQKERIKYARGFVDNGGTIFELLKDETFWAL
jgi:hypothetical protein|nr:MAG TPA: hypothetical protein [Caudoviricetes sp.]